jgi:signal peptidase I
MGKILRVAFWIAAVFGIVVGAARLVAIRWWQVPTDDPILEASLAPTLRGGDWVLLWRATEPHFGSLVVCPDPDNAGRFVVGRILGEGNDKVTIEGLRVQVNDHDARSESMCAQATFTIKDPQSGTEVDERCDLEAVGGILHMRGGTVSGAMIPVTSTQTVTSGQVFLVSDNRAFPYDSRTYGSIPRNLCKESVFFRLVGARGYMDVDSRFTYIQ